jgi:glycosyltransferase involved in cell wall biosynthesis
VRIAAFTKYDRDAASTRQRILQYVPALRSAGMEVSFHPLLGNDYVRSLALDTPVSWPRIAKAYLNRFMQLLRGPECDLIWIYAEAFPFLPASLERLVLRSGKPVVYDFDDAFFVTYDQHPSPWVRRILAGKLEPLIAGAAAICCGNEYLREYALRLNPRSLWLPTTVDTTLYRPMPKPSGGECLIGWIGSPSTWEDVRPMLPAIAMACRDHRARFHVVGAGSKAQADWFEGMKLVDWSEASEVSEVQKMDIGIMPLRDLPFQRGKCGYKLIQYMACGLPVVAAPVGVNSDLVEEGKNGFLATSQEEWAGALSRLIGSSSLRSEFGLAGRRKVEENYSLAAHAPRLVALFSSLATDAR